MTQRRMLFAFGFSWLAFFLTLISLREGLSTNVSTDLQSLAMTLVNKGLTQHEFYGRVQKPIRGKFLLINVDSSVSEIQGYLPHCLAPSSVDEVGTIGVISWKTAATGRIRETRVNGSVQRREPEYWSLEWVSLYNAATSDWLGSLVVNNYKTYGSPGSTDDMNHLMARGGIIGTANKKWNLIRSLLLMQRIDANGAPLQNHLRAWEWVALNPVPVSAGCAALFLLGFLTLSPRAHANRASSGWAPAR